jgi:ubiquinone/menaquinone biosynthesis C-methylase UbiE
MESALLSLLSCKCGGKFVPDPPISADSADIEEGFLSCACGVRIPVRGGIPRFVPADNEVESFSFQWLKFRRTQLDREDSRESEETFFAKTLFQPGELRGKTILDAGCGMGRFLDVASKHGAACVGVDLSFAVEAAHENLGDRPNVHIIQADLRELPFPDASFDFIYSIGVLHHTPDCRTSFLSLLRLLKPGGKIAIWLYHLEAYRFSRSERYRRLTTRLPPRFLHALCHVAVPYYYLTRIPRLGARFYNLLPISVHPGWRWRILDTFDWYSPKYQSKHTFPEVFGWFREAGLIDIEIADPAVTVCGRKPA